MNHIKLFLKYAGIAFISTVLLEATEPRQWTVSTQREFLQGNLKGVSATSDGKLILAPALNSLLDTDQPFIYASVIDRSGNLFLGTGNEGKVFRLSPDGQSQELARLTESGVYSLAVDSQDRIFAGTSPDGRVYLLSNQGVASTFFDPNEKYIWSMTTDSEGNLFVGTGPQGTIYKVNPQGESRIFYNSKETHIMSLAWDLEGNLLVGTAPGGLLFRISPDGSPFVVHDSPLQEIKAITVDRYGNIYAAALSHSTASASEAVTSKTASVAASTASRQASQTSGEVTVRISTEQPGRTLIIHRIDRDNLVETLYTSQDEVVFDVQVRDNGNLLVATGNKGRIISIDPRRFVTLLAQTPEQQVTQLFEKQGKVYAVTSNLGRVFELLSQPSRTGLYESKVFDAGMLSSWGMIRWQLNSPTPSGIQVYTRSGNTASTDQTWNGWNGPYTDLDGSYIESPPARYLQWKIEFKDSEESTSHTAQRNALERVSVAFIQRNMAPRLNSVTVHSPGLAFLPPVIASSTAGVSPGGPDQFHIRSLPRSVRGLGKIPGITPPPRRIYTPGARSISWTARDPNQDDLTYSIFYQAQGENVWKELKKNLTESFYTLDGVSFPDGVYFIKVVASDSPSNPTSQAQDNEIISKAFVISNRSPSVEPQTPQIEGSRVNWQFTVQTNESVVHQAEYSIDGGQWSILFPQDGIADSELENYSVSLEDLQPGEHIITIRVGDSVGNIGTGKTTVSIP